MDIIHFLLSSMLVLLPLQNWFKRITVHAMDGRYIKANDGKGTNLTPRTIAGPLCYATDIVSKVHDIIQNVSHKIRLG